MQIESIQTKRSGEVGDVEVRESEEGGGISCLRMPCIFVLIPRLAPSIVRVEVLRCSGGSHIQEMASYGWTGGVEGMHGMGMREKETMFVVGSWWMRRRRMNLSQATRGSWA